MRHWPFWAAPHGRTVSARSRSNPRVSSFEVPRSLRKRRPACRLAGAVTETERGTAICWTSGEDTQRAPEHLVSVEEALPAGKSTTTGWTKLARHQVSSSRDGGHSATSSRNLVGDERVLAVAKGTLASEAGIVTLTDQRLLLVQDDLLSSTLLDALRDSIGGLVLGKKSTGETCG